MSDTDKRKPIVALAMGDPAGISPELTARLLALPELREAADLIVIGDRRVLAAGAAVAGTALDIDIATTLPARPGGRPVLLDRANLDPATVQPAVAAAAGGRFALDNYSAALELTAAGRADAVCFTPFNKAAMRLAHPPYEDEIGFTQGVLGLSGPASEFNVLDGLWNARVTSHVPMSAVPGMITLPAILQGLGLTDTALREAGLAGRIAVAGLNPHAGDGGNFGREEIEVIGPAVEAARRAGIDAQGPFPADTVFLRARSGAFDAVLTMYHDQGQIAMKLMGFDRGVTLLGGFPFPICTPAHGTAYDIAGTGVADIGASRAAVLLAARMAARRFREGERAA